MPQAKPAFLRALVVAGATLVGVSCLRLTPASQLLASRPSVPATSSTAPPTAAGALEQRPSDPPLGSPHRLGAADGAVPEGATVFDDHIPAVANLDPALLEALRRAATEASHDGVDFDVNSGWRSPAYQLRLLGEAVARYGSEEEAARWVAAPSTSAHVSGDAIDLDSEAAAWLSERGAEYGICEIYDNEPWHYELRPDAVDHSCPRRYPDPAHDPRMQP